MDQIYRGEVRNGRFEAWILNFDFRRKFLQRIFTFHYAAMIISYKEGKTIAHSCNKTRLFRTHLKKIERSKPRLWKWSTKSSKLYLQTCVEGVNRLSLKTLDQLIREHDSEAIISDLFTQNKPETFLSLNFNLFDLEKAKVKWKKKHMETCKRLHITPRDHQFLITVSIWNNILLL